VHNPDHDFRRKVRSDLSSDGVCAGDAAFGYAYAGAAGEFLELLGRPRETWPRGRLVIIPGNLSIHTTPDVRAWVAAPDGRERLEFLLLHGS
jgi:hypothetical protein